MTCWWVVGVLVLLESVGWAGRWRGRRRGGGRGTHRARGGEGGAMRSWPGEEPDDR